MLVAAVVMITHLMMLVVMMMMLRLMVMIIMRWRRLHRHPTSWVATAAPIVFLYVAAVTVVVVMVL